MVGRTQWWSFVGNYFDNWSTNIELQFKMKHAYKMLTTSTKCQKILLQNNGRTLMKYFYLILNCKTNYLCVCDPHLSCGCYYYTMVASYYLKSYFKVIRILFVYVAYRHFNIFVHTVSINKVSQIEIQFTYGYVNMIGIHT